VAQEEATLATLRNVPGKLPVRVQHSLVSAGTQFTCFTGTKVQILTLQASRRLAAAASRPWCWRRRQPAGIASHCQRG